MPQFDLPVIPPEPAARTTANATCTTDAQFAHSPAEVLRRRRERIQAANEAVDEYMRASDTRDYRAAFRHIERTRPELFAQMQGLQEPRPLKISIRTMISGEGLRRVTAQRAKRTTAWTDEVAAVRQSPPASGGMRTTAGISRPAWLPPFAR